MFPVSALMMVVLSSPVQDAYRDEAIVLGSEYVARARRIQPGERARVDVEHERPRFDARAARIQEELASLGPHDWAGNYYQGDGLGVNVTLVVAPKSGATYSWSGCLGTYDLNHGSIASISADGIELELAIDPQLNEVWYEAFLPHPYMSERWVPVSWGKERFLIPDCQLIRFCNAVNDGSRFLPFPRRIEGDDWHREVERSEVLPGVPPAYRPFLLDEPLTTEIIECSEPAVLGTFPDGTTVKYLVSATVGLGSDAGLLPGMQLHAVAPRRGTGVVVDAGATRAAVEFRFAKYDADRDTPRSGWPLSTLRRSSKR